MTRDEAIKDIRENIKPVVGGKSLDMAIEALERKHGKWEFYSRDEDAFDVYGNESWAIRYYCSNCNFMHAFIENHTAQYNFCPNCGSEMRGDND